MALAWRWIAAAFVFWTASFVALASYQAAAGSLPNTTSVVDIYLLFYPTLLIGLLRFPRRLESRSGGLRALLDVATIALSAAAALWILVLEPTANAGGHNLLDGIVSSAYPVGDLLLVFGLTYVIKSALTADSRAPIQLLAVGVLLAVGGDVTEDWLNLHPQVAGYAATVVPYIARTGATVLYALAALRQQAARQQETWSRRRPGRDATAPLSP